MRCYWGKSIEELDELLKSQNKREKKVKDKFTPENLVKPTNAKNLFTKDFVIECKEKNIKFSLSGLSIGWNSLTENQKNKYIKAAEKEKQAYLKQYEVLKNEAIKNGSLSADKPKGPTTAFFRYLADNRETIKQKLIDDGETEDLNTKVPTKAGKLWKELSSKAKEPYELAYKNENEKYIVLLEEWKSKETSRLKKLDGKSDDIKVEESGNVNTLSTDAPIENTDLQVEKVSKSKKTTKTEAVAKIEKVEKTEPVTKSAKATKAANVEKTEPVAKAPKAEKTEKVAKGKKVEKIVPKVNLTKDEDEDDEEEDDE